MPQKCTLVSASPQVALRCELSAIMYLLFAV
jgi:hypothetical protein